MVRVVDQEFWVHILVDLKDFPLIITSLVAAVIRSLGVVAGYTQLWLMPGSQDIKGGRV